jgi:beta-glucanase (GH16 family)
MPPMKLWMACVVALTLSSASSAVRSHEAAPLDLSGYHVSFEDTFHSLSVSAWGPGTRWIAHTPWNGDFGDAQFVDPTPGFPFTTSGGFLRIEARKGADGKWRSGLLASVDPQGSGFTQQYGYFEMKAKLPGGPGLWPAFWLIGNQGPGPSAEIDIMEAYGVAPDSYQFTIHTWPKTPDQKALEEKFTHSVPTGSLYADFHQYGVSVEADWIIFYFDRQEIGRTPTPAEHRRPMFILLDLGLGSGWPIDQTPNPSVMQVAYVRAYQKNGR